MSVSHKSSNTGIFRLMVYSRALHPELFEVRKRCSYRHGDDYEVEAWVTSAGHVVRFQANGNCLTETVLVEGDHLPETGLVQALPCLGEKEFEMPPEDGLKYVTTLQTESLIDNLYAATFHELNTLSVESDAMAYEWKDDDGSPCLTVLDVEKYKKEFHIQSYHLQGTSNTVLRTQSIFEIV